MKKRLNIKKFVSWILISAVIMGCMDMFGFGKDFGMVYAAEESENSYFLEGYATGKAFDSKSESWVISTILPDGIDDKYAENSNYHAKIEENEHSGEREKVIRLVDGVELTDLDSPGNDHRAGVALMNSMVKLGEEGQFSVKFTFSMPDTCRRTTHGNGNHYEKDPGGDGITFLITSSENVKGIAGGGIGYQGITDSVGVEFDSFYNIGNGMEFYDPAYPGTYTFDKNTYDNTGFKRDHIAVVTGGANSTPDAHFGTKFLYDYRGDEYEYEYEYGFTQEGDLSVAIEEADNILFTAWVEFDGTNLYVHCAQGDFNTADRTNQAIALTVNEVEVIEQLKEFGGKDVKVGFTAAIGGSKANHTIHSVAFVNEYLPDGIQVPYIERYYVEDPNATEGYITVNGKKYVIDKEHMVGSGTTGGTADITPLDTEYSQYYTPVDPAIPAAEGYMNSAIITSDGKTVVCQFFDRIPHTDSWQYTANGNVITGECTSTTGICDKNSEVADKKIVLTAPDMVYNGNPYNQASYTDNLTAVTGGTVGQIYYEGVGSTQYTYSTTPPTEIGTYRAIVEIDGVRAVKEFRILPVPLVQPQPSMEKDESPKTGDADNDFDWLMLMLGSGLALLVTGKMLFKKED